MTEQYNFYVCRLLDRSNILNITIPVMYTLFLHVNLIYLVAIDNITSLKRTQLHNTDVLEIQMINCDDKLFC